jgi:transposase
MSYIIEQKLGKHIYLYEVSAYWDKAKGQARQKRRYLGKKDRVTGCAIKPRSNNKPQAIEDYGNLYTLRQIAELSGLREVLMENFPEQWKEILHLAYYRVLENKAYYLEKLWSESAHVESNMIMGTKRISNLLRSIGCNSNGRMNFFRKWIKRHNKSECVFFDITSISSYSKNIDFIEWGYNRDREKLPQMNIGMLQGYPEGLPFYYHAYPGSIADVSTIKNIIQQTKGLVIEIGTMVMDKGFYSSSNLSNLQEARIKFVMPLPTTLKVAKEFLSKHQMSIQSPLQAFYRRGHTIFHIQDEIIIGEHKLQAHLYFDEQKRLDEVNNLFRQLEDLEFQLSQNTFDDVEEAAEFMNRTMRGSAKLYGIKNLAEKISITRKRNAISHRINYSGKMILISNNRKLHRDQIINLYRQKDDVEKLFDIMKNEIEDARLRVQSRESMDGSLFILFIAMVIYVDLTKRMQQSNLFKKYSVTELLGELKKVRVITMTSGAPYLTEISKKQREIWDAISITQPVIPSY